MTDLVEFLRARYDDKEAQAKIRLDDDSQYGQSELDPEQALREVEADRLLLEQFRLRGDSVRATVQPATGGVWDDLLRLLALPYADHKDYRNEWQA